MWRDIAACSWSSASTKQSASISLCVVTHWPPNISHPPTTDLFFFFFSLFTPFFAERGGVGARLDGENISVGNRDVESAELIYGKYCKNCSRRHSKNLFPSVSPGLSPFFFFFFFFSSLSLFLGGCRVLLRSVLMGKTQKKETGGYVRADRSVTHFIFIHWTILLRRTSIVGNGEYWFTGGLQNLFIKDVVKYVEKIAIASAV